MRTISTPYGGFKNNRWRPSRSRPRFDFACVAQAALQQAGRLVPAWLPQGKQNGHEWVVLNPTRTDTHAGSFSINLLTGRWADFATGDKGGDLISLRAFLDGSSQFTAAQRLARELGL